MIHDIAVIGGGAAGLCAAIEAARAGADTVIIEGNEACGRKLLSTGNGRCNYANLDTDIDKHFHSNNMDIARAVLEDFSPEAVISFFEEMGVRPALVNGYVYPYTNRARDFVECLLLEIKRLGIGVINNARAREIKKEEDGFTCFYDGANEGVIKSKTCIIACGGMAFPVSGSNGSGIALAKSFGHSSTDIAPGLVELYCGRSGLKKCKGIRIKAKVSIFADGVFAATDTGEVQLTEMGISGIPVFNVSRHALLALKRGREAKAELDLLPDVKDAEELLTKRFLDNGWGKSVSEALMGLFDKRIIELLLKEAKVPANEDANLISQKQIRDIVRAIKGLKVGITGSGGFKKAQITAGGIRLTEIDPVSMESVLCRGLYLCGELLDADAVCGGYNLTWAWAGGIRAGRSAAGRVLSGEE